MSIMYNCYLQHSFCVCIGIICRLICRLIGWRHEVLVCQLLLSASLLLSPIVVDYKQFVANFFIDNHYTLKCRVARKCTYYAIKWYRINMVSQVSLKKLNDLFFSMKMQNQIIIIQILFSGCLRTNGTDLSENWNFFKLELRPLYSPSSEDIWYCFWDIILFSDFPGFPG